MKSIIITLCGSGKFKSTFQEIYINLTKQGVVALTPSIFDLCNLDSIDYSMADYIHKNLDDIHETKILISDFVLIVNPKGYIGEDTKKEIEFAKRCDKQIIYFYENCSDIIEYIMPYIYRIFSKNNNEFIGEDLDKLLKTNNKNLNKLELRVKKLEDTIIKSSNSYGYLQFVTECQKILGVPATGIADNKLLSSTIKVSKNTNFNHPIILPIQKYLNFYGYNVGKEDCFFGILTEKGLKSFQSQFMRTPDGVLHAGKRSWKELLKIN